jgi:hypothetical protein
MLDDVIAHQVTQRIGVPPIPTQKRLLPPRAGVAGSLRAHPSSLPTLLAQQTVQEQSGIYRRALLREQRQHPSLHIPQR